MDLEQVGKGAARKPRVLWANVHCMLDTSSAAALAALGMVHQLVHNGYDGYVLGAMVFDHAQGATGLRDQRAGLKARTGDELISLHDGLLEHKLFVTHSTRRDQMTSQEEGAWFSLYQQALALCKPDLVIYTGTQAFDYLIPVEAKVRGIPVVYFQPNENELAPRRCRDVDLILTAAQAKNTPHLLQILQPLSGQYAGDLDVEAALRQWHKFGLDDRPPI
jgi:hypothetical protein